MAYCAGLCGFEILHFFWIFCILVGILKFSYVDFGVFLIVFWGVFRVFIGCFLWILDTWVSSEI